MAGIYVHIPFCKQACNYCDFHFSVSLKNKETLLQALLTEIKARKNYLIPANGKLIYNTIYFGGGTPSILSQSELMKVMEALYENYEIANDAEITLEANPDDLSEEKIKQLKGTPINRLSIGIQSFFDEDLKLMNRAHNSQDAVRAVKASQDKGFENITIDLIYGIPTLTNAHWKENLHSAFAMDVKHISAYCLTVEPKTALAYKIKTGEIKNVDERQSSEQFEMMLELMKANNFQQYEISNFCKDNYFSKHNSNYWKKETYVGIGPSAHSYDGKSRQWNVSNNAQYISGMEKGEPVFEKEELSADQLYNEYVLTSLRTMWGTDLIYIEEKFGNEYFVYCLKEAEKYIEQGKLLREKNKLFLSDKGKLFADRIASDLFKIK